MSWLRKTWWEGCQTLNILLTDSVMLVRKKNKEGTSFKSKTESLIDEPYHLLHLVQFRLVNVMSIHKKRYTLVIVDEFTRFTWVYFLHKKDETPLVLLDHLRLIKMA